MAWINTFTGMWLGQTLKRENRLFSGDSVLESLAGKDFKDVA